MPASNMSRNIALEWWLALAWSALAWSLLPGLAIWVPAVTGHQAPIWSGFLPAFGWSAVQVSSLIGGALAGFSAQVALGLGGGARRTRVALALYLGMVLPIVALALFQPADEHNWPWRFGPGEFLLALVVGTLMGRSVRQYLAPWRWSERSARALWPWLAGLPLLLPLLPIAPDSSLTSPSPTPFLELPQRFYLFIKAAILWLPVGAVFALAGQGSRVRLGGLAGLLGLVLVVNAALLDWHWQTLMALLAALPGLALGIWLVEQGGWVAREKNPDTPEHSAPTARPVMEAAREEKLDAPGETGSPPPTLDPALLPEPKWLPPSLAAKALAVLLLLATYLALVDFPRWPGFLAMGMALYAALLWWRPLAWLVAVPAVLPVLDLAPWTGWFFLDELDLLLATTLALVLWRGKSPTSHSWSLGGLLAMAVLGVSAIVSLAIGADGWPALDGNSFSSYWSPYNSLRVAKGFFWGGVLLLMMARQRANPQRLTRLLALGMSLGLAAVCLVGLWERWLYAGLADQEATYRIVGLFSSMHTGGGHIEAYLAAAIPFAWLGLRHLRSLWWAVPLLIASVYVLLYTGARGGVLAFGVSLALLVVGSLRLGWLSGRRPLNWILPVGAIGVMLGVLALGVSGGYLQERFAQTSQDGQTRWQHWTGALDMRNDGLATQAFGMGLGSFPRVYLQRGPLETRSGTYGFGRVGTGQVLRLGAGATLYYAQRVDVSPQTAYRLSLEVRSEAAKARLDVPLCEKQMLNSRRCAWTGITIPADGQWRRVERTVSSGDLATGGPLGHLPVELFLYNASDRGVVEVNNVSLQDPNGRELLCNGDFEQGGDCWFFKTHSHLPWHIKNFLVHVLFEQGWVGLLATLALLLMAARKLLRAGWAGEPLAWTLLAALAGMLTVGLFDSLLDAPRLAMLLIGFALLGATDAWRALPAMSPRRRRRRGNGPGPGPGHEKQQTEGSVGP